MSGDHRSTTAYKEELLQNSGYSRLSNTQIFEKGNKIILSPAVAENKKGKYWFDVREKIIDKIDKNKPIEVLIRIVPNKFIFTSWDQLKTIIETHTKTDKGENKVWSFEIMNNFTEIHCQKSSDDNLLSVVVANEENVVSNLDR